MNQDDARFYLSYNIETTFKFNFSAVRKHDGVKYITAKHYGMYLGNLLYACTVLNLYLRNLPYSCNESCHKKRVFKVQNQVTDSN